MYCDQCGAKISEDSQFCSQCGARIRGEGHSPSEMPETRLDKKNWKSQKLRRLMPVFIPVASLIAASGIVGYSYYDETQINEQVLSLKTEAEASALEGEYAEAEKLLKQASSLRPEYTVISEDLEGIKTARQYESKLKAISKLIQKSEFDQASVEIANIKEKITADQRPLYNRFNEEIQQKETAIKIGTVKQELNDLGTVDELSAKLSILSSLPEQEARAIRMEILNKIVSLSLEEAQAELTSKEFSAAISTLDKGLQYAVNDDKLLALRERVAQEQKAFEAAEQERMEKAMEAAAQEDLNNRTAAVEIADFSAEIDEYGDLYFHGTVKNIGTAPINSVTIFYRISDQSGSTLYEGSTSVYPYEIQAGASGAFEDVQYGVYQEATVDIDNITWYVE